VKAISGSAPGLYLKDISQHQHLCHGKQAVTWVLNNIEVAELHNDIKGIHDMHITHP
jgi:hypothetical protein